MFFSEQFRSCLIKIILIKIIFSSNLLYSIPSNKVFINSTNSSSMIWLWCMLVLSAKCSTFSEISLDRAEQSSTFGGNSGEIADNAIDNNLTTYSRTSKEDLAWLRVYFTSSSTVERVVVEKGRSNSANCVYTVSVYEGEVQTVCGTYSKDG